MTSRQLPPQPAAPSRRTVVKAAAATAAVAVPVLGSAVTAHAADGPAFLHGVASGAPPP